MSLEKQLIFNPFTGNLDVVNEDITLSLEEKKEFQTKVIESILISVDNTGIEPETSIVINNTSLDVEEI